MSYKPPINGKLTAASLLTYVYPVGSIYMSTVNTSPASFLGGTWSAIQDRMLIGAGNTYGATGTGGTTTAQLTATELPSHTHTFSDTSDSNGAHTHLIGRDQNGGLASNVYTVHDTGSSGAQFNSPTTSNGAHAHTVAGTSASNGTGNSFSIVNPYYAVYMWQRTA